MFGAILVLMLNGAGIIPGGGGGLTASQTAVLAHFSETSGDILIDTNFRYEDDKGPRTASGTEGFIYDDTNEVIYDYAGSTKQGNSFINMAGSGAVYRRVTRMESYGYYGSNAGQPAPFPLSIKVTPAALPTGSTGLLACDSGASNIFKSYNGTSWDTH